MTSSRSRLRSCAYTALFSLGLSRDATIVSGFVTGRMRTRVAMPGTESAPRRIPTARGFVPDPGGGGGDDDDNNNNESRSTLPLPPVPPSNKKNNQAPTTVSGNDGPSPTTTTDEPYIEIQYESYFDGTKPDSSWNLARNNFAKQGTSLVRQGLEQLGLREADPLRPPGCLNLKLSNEAVLEAERRRVASGGGVEAHPISRALYDGGCLLLDRLFDGRPIQRFWFLETIARIPYFSYVSMLHLYESFGWFRAVELRKVHAAEDWNELHHLLIMESLGGNSQWSDRFLGYHVAFAYYWFLVVVYLGSPRIAYQFMELLEAHAVDTYTTFVRENRETLRKLPPPAVAASYYRKGDLYLFDDFMTTRRPGTRRPPCETLLDVFENIATDEGEHVKTMKACQDYAEFGTKVVSSHLRYGIGPDGTAGDDHGDQHSGVGIHQHPGSNSNSNSSSSSDAQAKRRQWQEWSESINDEWKTSDSVRETDRGENP